MTCASEPDVSVCSRPVSDKEPDLAHGSLRHLRGHQEAVPFLRFRKPRLQLRDARAPHLGTTVSLMLPARSHLLALLHQCNILQGLPRRLGLRLYLLDIAFRKLDAFAWLGTVHLRVCAQERRMGPAIHAVGLRRGLSQLGDELRPRAIELLLQLLDLVFQTLLLAVQWAQLVAAAPFRPVLLGEAPAVGAVLAVLMDAVA